MSNKTSDHDDKIMQCSTFDELLDAEYGSPGHRSVNNLMPTQLPFIWLRRSKQNVLKLV